MRTRNTHLMLERISKIHQKIKSQTFPNQITLAKEFEVSVPTVSRDIQFMKDRFLAPIEYDRKHNGYYYNDRDYKMPDFEISSEKLQALMTIKSLFRYFSMTPIYEEVKNIVAMLSEQALNIRDIDITSRIALPPRTKVQLKKEYWYKMVEAMQTNRVVEFDYKGLTTENFTHRRVRPYQILIDDGACYLFGWCEERKAERVFAFSRMFNLVITSSTFELPNNYEYEHRCGGGHFGLFTSEERQKITVKFYGFIKQVVSERVWAEDQVVTTDESDDSLVITFSSNQETKVLSWVLGYGSHAKPVSPPEFVKKWQDEVIKMKQSFDC